MINVKICLEWTFRAVNCLVLYQKSFRWTPYKIKSKCGSAAIRWSTTRSSKVNLHHVIYFTVLYGAYLATLRSIFRPTKPSSPLSGLSPPRGAPNGLKHHPLWQAITFATGFIDALPALPVSSLFDSRGLLHISQTLSPPLSLSLSLCFSLALSL